MLTFFLFLILLPHGPLLICLLGMDARGVGTGLLWCDFEVFLHNLHQHQMAVNDLVCFVCVFLIL